MKTINSLSDISKIASARPLYIRWSRGPALDRKQKRSIDQVSHTSHHGLSAQNVHLDDLELLAKMIPEYQFLRGKDSKIYCWIFAADRNGTDSDGCPTIDSDTIQPLGRVSEDLVSRCQAYSLKYWEWARKGFISNMRDEINALFQEAIK